jgi:uncharacterized protein (TIGR02001 family)
MRKSLITTAVLGALAAPSFVFAADAAPAPDLTVAYNVGLYSQYIFRGMTQTDRKPALQGGIDLTHSSGFYLGMWGSNISWLRDAYTPGAAENATFYKKGGNLELDIYGGYRYNFGDTGLGIDVGALQYWYPGTERGRENGFAKANTTELYGALNYKWAQAKISGVVSEDAWGWGKYDAVGAAAAYTKNARGTYYAEINLTPPIGEWVGGGALAGVTGIVHVARQEFSESDMNASYTDYKLGLQKAFDGGVNLGAYWTGTSGAKDASWTYNGKNIGESTGTAYIQKTF